MRPFVLSLVTLSLALLATGCGVSPAAPGSLRTAEAPAARAAVEERTLVFNKRIVYSTIDILGVGKVYQAKLAAAGIKTINTLLLAGATRTDRAKLAKETGISQKLILTWVNHGDLMRVTGCGPEYARLLELAGIDTVMELSKRNSIHLVERLAEANDLGGGKKAVHRLPNVVTTTQWVDNAQKFVRLVKY
ncbi:MAG: DUF4332 domain-containing protein [Candidatus Sericytochromatia bacterium]